MALTKEELAELKIGDIVHDNAGNNYVVLAIEGSKITVMPWKPVLRVILERIIEMDTK